jgi:outer membrane biosynthesis protein TonB
MKVSMLTAVGLVVVTFAFWIGHAEAQHRGGTGRPAAVHPPSGGGRPSAGKAHPSQPKVKAHPPQPKVKAQQKAKGATAKPAQKKQQHKDLAETKHVEKKKNIAKEKAREHAKKAEKKAPAKAAADHESIALLRAAHHKLHEADHDYDGHRHRAAEHVGSALGHLGSSAQTPGRSGKGRTNSPQSVSDAIMREARGSLEMIKSRLAAKSADAKGHREAHGAVDAAIREIGLALTVR